MVYTAFSEAVVNGIWHKVGWGSLLFSGASAAFFWLS
ncbi:hypothetical protein ACLK14_13590 [Escherichia coli]